MRFFEILRLFQAAMKIGPPPDIGNESAFRKWVCDILCFLADLAELTAIDGDDRLVAALHALVDHDQRWALLYAILLAASQYLRPEEQDGLLVSSTDVATLSDEVQIDPATLLLIIQAVMQLIDWWRKRRA